MKNLCYTIQELNYIESVKKTAGEIRRKKMEEDKQKELEETQEKDITSYGITEAPKDHPANTDGKLKVIME